MTATYNIPNPIAVLNDDLILDQLPAAVLKRLGDTEESGFHLLLNRRDLFCQNGVVRYALGGDKITVEFDE